MEKHFSDFQKKLDTWIDQRLEHAVKLAGIKLSTDQKDILFLSLRQTVEIALKPWIDCVTDLQNKLNQIMIKITEQRNNAEN